MPRALPLAIHTILADLVEKSVDEMFDDQFAENGNFVLKKVRGRGDDAKGYYYYVGYDLSDDQGGKAKQFSRYVGPADDPAIEGRVQRFRQIKQTRRERASSVAALVGAGLRRPPIFMGRLIETLAKAGVFRLRGVLVGTAAYQTYPALLGMSLDESAAITGDVDIAQFRSISIAVEDQTPPLLDVLRSVDPSFAPIPHQNDRTRSTSFRAANDFRLDVLVPNRGSDDLTGKPMPLPALGDGAAGEPLRFLDFLIYGAVRSVVLHGPGVSVNVPAPERYAVHKLIISSRRNDDAVGRAKSRKDVIQSGELIIAMETAGNGAILADAFQEAATRGPEWRRCLKLGTGRLAPEAIAALQRIAGRHPSPDASWTP
jgi:hypothetical protein